MRKKDDREESIKRSNCLKDEWVGSLSAKKKVVSIHDSLNILFVFLIIAIVTTIYMFSSYLGIPYDP